MHAIKANDTATLMERFHQSEGDCEYFQGLLSTRNKAETSISAIRSELGEGAGGKFTEIHVRKLGHIIDENHTIVSAIDTYNANVSKINMIDREIASLRKKLKIKKEIPAIDYLANFLQQRGDLGIFMMTEAGRSRMMEGMKKNASLIHLKVNGNAIDMVKEFEKPKQEYLKIRESDTIELSGPMLIDGVHMSNSDLDRQKNMNARTRFFFEFVASGVLLPTEILEPGKETTFRKEKFGKLTDGLSIKGVYDLRHGMTLERALKKQIPIFEKEAFSDLDPEL